MELDWLNIVQQILELAIYPALTASAAYFISWVKAKKKNEKAKEYAEMLDKTINDCVLSTTQTYVKALKEQNSFDEEAQKKAFQLTYNAVLIILTEDAKKYLSEATSDLETYITNKIEARIIMNKSFA